MTKFLPAALLGAFLLSALPAFADDARDALIRTEARINTLNPADAFSAAPENYEVAQLRLSEARVAEERNQDEESLWRSAEAELQAEIVQEKIKLQGLERTVAVIEAGLVVLRRELNS